jgi:putative ABC transport system ATP-binding protein
MDLLKKLNDDGTTIIQVTHNDAWAAYGNRIIQLADGWIVDGTQKVGEVVAATK